MILKRRAVRWTLGAAAALMVVMTLVHLPVVQHAMGWTHAGKGACPFGYGKQASAARGNAFVFATAAQHRPALGWSLVATTRPEIIIWAMRKGVACTPLHGGSTIECERLPDGALPSIDGVAVQACWFELDGRGIVHAIRTVRRATDAGVAARGFSTLRSELATSLGAPTTLQGSDSPGDLAAGLLRQAMFEFVRDDYVATVRVTNMGDGFAITESYAARPVAAKAG